MAILYVKSGVYAASAVANVARSTAYTVGTIVKSPAAVSVGYRRFWRCTTAGTTAASQPANWSILDAASYTSICYGKTLTDGTAVFTCISGESWTYPFDTLYDLTKYSIVLYGTRLCNHHTTDTILVSYLHTETIAGTANTDWLGFDTRSLGTGTNIAAWTNSTNLAEFTWLDCIKIISVDEANGNAYRAGATITWTAAGNLSGHVYWEGFNFIFSGAAPDFTRFNLGIPTQNSPPSSNLTFEKCTFTFSTSANTMSLKLGLTGGVNNLYQYVSILRFFSCTFTFANANDSIYIRLGKYLFRDCDFNVAGGGTVPTLPFTLFWGSSSLVNNTYQDIVMECCRLHQLNGSSVKVFYPTNVGVQRTKVHLSYCSLPALSTIYPINANYRGPNGVCSMQGCYLSGASTLYPITVITDKSIVQEDSTVYPSIEYAKNQKGQAYSMKVITYTPLERLVQFVELPWIDYMPHLGNVTYVAGLEILSSVSLDNYDMWFDAFYANRTDNAGGMGRASTRPATPLTAAVSWGLSPMTWVNKPSGYTAYNMTVSFTLNSNRTPVIIIPFIARPNTTIWYNPRPTFVVST